MKNNGVKAFQTKKAKKLTKEQKVLIYDILENEGLFQAVTQGYLDASVKGTALAPAVKAFKSAAKTLSAKLNAKGVGPNSYAEIEKLKTELYGDQSTLALGQVG